MLHNAESRYSIVEYMLVIDSPINTTIEMTVPSFFHHIHKTYLSQYLWPSKVLPFYTLAALPNDSCYYWPKHVVVNVTNKL
jgi:hypothetical protein